MIQIVGIRFKPAGKVYHFSSGNLTAGGQQALKAGTPRRNEGGSCPVREKPGKGKGGFRHLPGEDQKA